MNTVPHKAFEAAYFGRPYMTRDASGIREFLKHEETAIFVDTETPEAVARILDRTLTDKNVLERTGNLAKIRYDQVARQEKLQNKFIAILRTVTRS
jgi:glycosyltransferase involved in cell wall biosynthesis